jgi:hypothetical protein
MAFSEGIIRLQRIIEFISIDFRNKKEIMANLRNFNIIISYKTLERDLKQIKEELGIEIEYKRNVGYKCENSKFIQPINYTLEKKDMKVGYETEHFKVINVFEYGDNLYCNCLDIFSNTVFMLNSK